MKSREDFDRDVAVQPRIAAPIHFTHSACPKGGEISYGPRRTPGERDSAQNWRDYMRAKCRYNFPMRPRIAIITGTVALIGTTLLFAQRQTTPQPSQQPQSPSRGCPPGQTEVRAVCEAPEIRHRHSRLPAGPRSSWTSTLRRAKFPWSISTATRRQLDNMARLVREMDALNLRVQQPGAGQGERLQRNVDAIRTAPLRDRNVFANLDFRAFAPGWGSESGSARTGCPQRRGGAEDLSKTSPRRARRLPDRHRRSRARSGLGHSRPSERAGPHPYRRAPHSSSRRIMRMNASSSWHCFQAAALRRFEGQVRAARRRTRSHVRRHAKTRFIAAHFAYHGYDLKRGALLDNCRTSWRGCPLRFSDASLGPPRRSSRNTRIASCSAKTLRAV